MVDWRPCGLLRGQPTNPYAILILNQPINRNALNAIIEEGTYLVCADGAANWLLKYDCSNDNYIKKRLPDAIVGDLDSLKPETEKHYKDLGVRVVKDLDQYSPDFFKSLKWIKDAWSQSNGGQDLDVVVLGGLGGRVDQGFSQINYLCMASNDKDLVSGRTYLLSESSLSFMLGDGDNTIHIERGYFEENVGIIPVCGPTKISLSGFEWDVKDWPTEFGGQMSTSNHIRADELRISFDGPRPLFTMELASQYAATFT